MLTPVDITQVPTSERRLSASQFPSGTLPSLLAVFIAMFLCAKFEALMKLWPDQNMDSFEMEAEAPVDDRRGMQGALLPQNALTDAAQLESRPSSFRTRWRSISMKDSKPKLRMDSCYCGKCIWA